MTQPTTPSPTDDTQSLLDAVPDEQLTTLLALLLDAQHRLPDPTAAAGIADRLHHLDPDPLDTDTDADGSEPPPDSATAGDDEAGLTRAAIGYLLAADPATAAMLPRAIQLTHQHHHPEPDQPAQRFDPITLTIGGLILLALQTELDWKRTPNGRWKLRIHKRGMHDKQLVNLARAALHTPATPEPTASTGADTGTS